MKKLTKSQADTLAFIHITGSTKGIHTNTRVTLRFDAEAIDYNMDTYCEELTSKGLELLQESKSGIYKAYIWLMDHGFEHSEKCYTKKSMISFVNRESGATAFISTHSNKSHLYVSENGGYQNEKVEF